MSWNKATLTSKRRYVTVSVEADVDISLSDLDNEDLISELKDRNALPNDPPKGFEQWPEGTLETLADLLDDGQPDEARLFLEQTMRPKWDSEDAAKKAYEEAKKLQS